MCHISRVTVPRPNRGGLWIAALLALLTGPGCRKDPRRIKAEGNVILIVIETLRVDRLGIFGRSPTVKWRSDAPFEIISCRRTRSDNSWAESSLAVGAWLGCVG